jgi:Heterokaryon incompatibility protein (HET)
VVNNIIEEYIQNHLPIYLLSLPDMKLVKRSGVKRRMQSTIEELIEHCRTLEESSQSAYIRLSVMKETAYAILSHRWLPVGELTFQDTSKIGQSVGGFHKLMTLREETPKSKDELLNADNLLYLAESCKEGSKEHDYSTAFAVTKRLCESMSEEEKRRCGGFVKLVEFCNVAQVQFHCKYVWLDTGCINHSSSAELEESIRSMFNWYRNSEICVVHLNETSNALSLRKDAWFTRGWTLQELLAPRQIKFFDQSWRPLTHNCYNDKVPDIKLGVPLWRTIHEITGIPVSQLLSFEPGMQHIKERMVWASARKTTRIEDKAYCLIGIFDVSLSIAYGEGAMAFHRLQLEIMQRSDDKGLFAWRGQESAYNSMLAAGPECFFRSMWSLLPEVEREPNLDTTYALTNRGLRMSVPVYSVESMKGVSLPDGSDFAGSDSDEDDSRCQYELVVEGLGRVAVKLREHKYKHLKLAILGNVSRTTSVAILLVFSETTGQYKRIAILKVKRLSLWKEPVIIFIK